MSATHGKTTIVARLKDGSRVLCGRANCGRELAKVLHGGMSGTMLRDATDAPLRRSDGKEIFRRDPNENQDTYFLVFAPGWLPDDADLWTLTRGARRQYERDQQLARANALVAPREKERARQRLRDGRSTRFRRGIVQAAGLVDRLTPRQAEHRAMLLASRPVFARCPECTGINRMDHALLIEAAAWIPPENG